MGVVACGLVGCVRQAALQSGPSDSSLERTIPYPEGYDTVSEGASASNRQGDHRVSPYYRSPDLFVTPSTDSLTLIRGFRTYQQSREWSCGPSCALMVLRYYGVKEWHELEIAKAMKSNLDLDGDNQEEKGVANEKGEFGTATARMADFFRQLGWHVESSAERGTLKDGATFNDMAPFRDWVLETLRQGCPIMVEWIDWGGHWSVIVGYDTLGTDIASDDVVLLADPYDTTDHRQDGYTVVPAERFYYMWFDAHYLPDDQETQQWLIARPH